MAAAAVAGQQPPSPIAAVSPTGGGPSIVAGGLDTPGPPRDALGRLVLFIAVALAADQLLPWVVINNTTYMSMTEFGLPAVLLVLSLGLAIVPVVTPTLRIHPIWSTLPFAIGCLCLGFGIAVWLLLSPLANLASVSPVRGTGRFVPPVTVILPHWGLYLFVVGSLVLIGAGHRMMQAEHATSGPLPATAAQRTTEAPATAAGVALVITNLTFADVPAETPLDGATADGVAEDSPDGVPQEGGLTVPLPGSASWNQAPALPAPLRSKPTGPWRSQSVSPRGY